MSDLAEALRRAAGLLARRDYTRHQLAEKLLRRHSSETVQVVLERLQQRGALDDETAAQQRAGHCRLRRRWGDRKIRLDLRRMGIGAKIIDRVLARVNLELPQRECLAQLVQARVEKLGRPETAAQAQKLYQFCLRRGFDPQDVREAMAPYFESLDWSRSWQAAPRGGPEKD